MMWILYFVMLVAICPIEAQDIRTFISAARLDGTPVIDIIEGDPQDWAETLKSGGSWDSRSVSGSALTTLYKQIAFHQRKATVVYSDGKAGDIATFSLQDAIDGTAEEDVVFSYTSVEIGGLAVDWVSNNTYWTDQVYNWILMSPMEEDYKAFYTVIDTDLDKPGGIAVHPATSQLFWTDYGDSPKIERATLVGAERTTIIDTSLVRPTALNIDYSTNTLYWLDIGKSEILSSDFNGGNVRSFLKASAVSSMVGFTLDEYLILGVSDTMKELYIIERDDPTNNHTQQLNYNHIYDIQVHAQNRQPELISPCASMPLPCSYICTTTDSNTNWQCVCPDGHYALATYFCQVSSYIEGPRYVYTLATKLCRYPVWTPVMTDEELSHNCLADFTIPRTYYVGHLYAMRYLYVAYEDILAKVVMQDGSSFVSKQLSAGNVKGIAVDWMSRNIYWANNEVIIVVNSDMEYPYDLMRLDGLNGLTVDPIHGYLYYTCVESLTYIGRAYLNGDSKSTFVSGSLGKPEQLVVDYHDNRLYWADSLKDTIESIQLDGTDRRVVITISNSNPFGIAVFQDHVVWTDQSSAHQGLYWTYKDGTSSDIRNVLKTEAGGTITLFGEYSQPPDLTNPCSLNNGGCEHLCLPTLSGRTCQCSGGYDMESDGKGCKFNLPESDTALLVIDVHHSEIFHMDLNTSRVTSIPVTNMVNPVAIDLDPSEELMFWTDVAADTIKRSTLTGDDEIVIKTSPSVAVPDGLAVDWKAKLLIYTDTGVDKIVRMDYNGGNAVTIITSVDEPRAIALDYDSRIMYWTDWGAVPKIEAATYDGNSRRTVVESTNMVWPNGLTINRQEQVLYWCDGNLGRIESIKTDGTDRKLLTISLGSHFFGIVYFEDYLYTTSWSRSSIQKMHKNGGTLLNIGDPFLLRAYGITAYRRANAHSTPTTPSTTSTTSTTTTTTSTTSTLPSTTTTTSTTSTLPSTTTTTTSTTSTTSTLPSTTTTTPSTTATRTSTITSTTSSTTTMPSSSTSGMVSSVSSTQSTPTTLTSTPEDGKPVATQGPLAGNTSDETPGVHTNLVIIVAVVVSALVLIIATLTVGIYCCLKKRKNSDSSDGERLHLPHLEARSAPPPPYTFTNEAFKEDGKDRPVSSIYDTIPDNPYESPGVHTSVPSDYIKTASSGYITAQDVSLQENSLYSQEKADGGYVSLYQANQESRQVEGQSNEDYLSPVAYGTGTSPATE